MCNAGGWVVARVAAWAVRVAGVTAVALAAGVDVDAVTCIAGVAGFVARVTAWVVARAVAVGCRRDCRWVPC